MIKINSRLKNTIKKELSKFKKPKNKNEMFKELCFCILVANNNLERTYNIWLKIKNKFLLQSNSKDLRKILKKLGYRFYRKRAEYIVYARKHINQLWNLLKTKDEYYIREWLAKNIKGLGYKEASHFLRNIGYENFAILDRHVLRFLLNKKIIKNIPRNLNKKHYLEIENKLKNIAKKIKCTLAELDFYIFYIQTKKFPIK